MEKTAEDYRRFYNANDPRRWGRASVPYSVPADIARDSGVVIEVGCGNGPVAFPVGLALYVTFPFARLLALVLITCLCLVIPGNCRSVTNRP